MSSVGPPGSKPPPGHDDSPPTAPAASRRAGSRLGYPWISLALIAVAAAAFMALGGDGESDADEKAIRAAVVRAVTSSDPGICHEVFSDRWLATHFAAETQSTVGRCREVTAQEGRKAEAADVSTITVEGGRATATVVVTGGNVGRATLVLELVESDDWMLDELSDIEVDRDRYLAAQREGARLSDVHADAEPLLLCMLGYARREVSAAQIETSLLAGDERFYEQSFSSCVPEFRRMFFSPATIGARSGYPPAQARCISRVASSSLSDAELRILFVAFLRDEPSQDILADERDAAIARCATGRDPLN